MKVKELEKDYDCLEELRFSIHESFEVIGGIINAFTKG